MKLCVVAALFGGMKIEKALAYCQKVGLEAIELPVGPYPGDPWNLQKIYKKPKRLAELKMKIADAGLVVQGISAHGNPLHPNTAIAKVHQQMHHDGVMLAAEFETVVINFSGCPAGTRKDTVPNFVTCPWPPEFSEASDYQWDVTIAHWTGEEKFAREHGAKIAFEAHPGMVVHSPEDIVRLRKLTGKNIGANFDPSHFWWQGIDPLEAIRFLGENNCLFHFHAKDCYINPAGRGTCGNLDTKGYGEVNKRGWVFCTVGYGHGEEFWKPCMRTLRAYGYDGAISIEHEDSLMSIQDGFEKAVAYLNPIILKQPAAKPWWF